MPFQITTTRDFAAAHQLTLYDGSLEPLHGHNWRVAVTVSSQQLDKIGVVMDFHELEPFVSMNPSAENVALHVGRSLHAALPEPVKLARVEVWETDSNSAIYHP